MSASEQVIELLASIDRSLKLLVKQQAAVVAAAPKPIASAKDLDGPHGDPTLRFNPRNWTGAPFTGRRFSECPPELLDIIAESFDWMARKDDEAGATTGNGKPKSEYRRMDAARARGWAQRMRAGLHTSPNVVPRDPEPTTEAALDGEPAGWGSGDDDAQAGEGWGGL